MASRRKIRECALQMLFQWDMGKDPPAKVEELFWSNNHPANKDTALQEAANSLFHGTVEASGEIDGRIRAAAEHWRMDRMAAVDRNILRLGAYELLHRRETPPPVVINEALEIARKFSGDDSVEFINGVLDQIRKEADAPPGA